MARLDLSRAGHDLAVAQMGSDAVVADRTVGDIIGVDGATLSRVGPVAPFGLGATNITLFSALSAVYAVDADHGTVVALDPRTPDQRSDLVPLAAQLSPDNTIVDGTVALGARREDRRRPVGPPRRQTAAPALCGGTPPRSWSTSRAAPWSSAWPIARLASWTQPPATLSRRRISTCNVATRSRSVAHARTTRCSSRSPPPDYAADRPRHRAEPRGPAPPGVGQLGRPVELGHRAFVPDLAKGSVYVVDLETRRLLTNVVLPGGAAPKLQLIPQDDRVFYNDPNSDRAGVIRLDGSTTGFPKYDPSNPTNGLTPTPQATPAQTADGTTSTQTPASGQTAAPGPSPTAPAGPPGPRRRGRERPPRRRVRGDRDDRRVESLRRGRGPLTLSVELSDGSPPSRVDWGFGDASSGVGTQLSHSWAAPGVYQVTARATEPHRRRRRSRSRRRRNPRPRRQAHPLVPN